jgi:DNA anti-recombination protein RmuC
VAGAAAVTTPDPRSERKRTLKLGALSVVVSLVAAGVAAGVAVKVEGKRARAPVAEIASEVATLKAEHATMRDTLAQTRTDLDKQSEKINATVQKTAVVAKRQDELEDKHKVAEVHLADLEKSQKDLESRQARVNMVLSSKIAGVENRLGERVTSLTKALELIDFVNGGPPRAGGSPGTAAVQVAAPAKAEGPKPAPAKPADKPKADAAHAAEPDAHGGGHGGHHAP